MVSPVLTIRLAREGAFFKSNPCRLTYQQTSAHSTGFQIREFTIRSVASDNTASLIELWETMIASANTQNEILLLLQESGLKQIADRLRYLQDLARNDPEEPSMAIDSMRALVGFLATERSLPDPEIGISPNGLAQVEWRIPPDGILALEFLTTGLIRFAAVSASTEHRDIRLRVNGTLPKGGVLDAIRSFTSSIDQSQ